MYCTEANASVSKEFVHDYLNPIVSKVVPKKPVYVFISPKYDFNINYYSRGEEKTSEIVSCRSYEGVGVGWGNKATLEIASK